MFLLQEEEVPFELELIGMKQDKLFQDVGKVIFKFILSTKWYYWKKEGKQEREHVKKQRIQTCIRGVLGIIHKIEQIYGIYFYLQIWEDISQAHWHNIPAILQPLQLPLRVLLCLAKLLHLFVWPDLEI